MNLEYIGHLTTDHRDFLVLDSKTSKELTKSILLRVVSSFSEHQGAMQGMMKSLAEDGPLGLFGKIVEQNMGVWANFNDLGKKNNYCCVAA